MSDRLASNRPALPLVLTCLVTIGVAGLSGCTKKSAPAADGNMDLREQNSVFNPWKADVWVNPETRKEMTTTTGHFERLGTNGKLEVEVLFVCKQGEDLNLYVRAFDGSTKDPMSIADTPLQGPVRLRFNGVDITSSGAKLARMAGEAGWNLGALNAVPAIRALESAATATEVDRARASLAELRAGQALLQMIGKSSGPVSNDERDLVLGSMINGTDSRVGSAALKSWMGSRRQLIWDPAFSASVTTALGEGRVSADLNNPAIAGTLQKCGWSYQVPTR